MNNNELFEVESTSLLDYIKIIRYYLAPVLGIFAVCFLFSLMYAIAAVNIYSVSAEIKISKPRGNILDPAYLTPDFESARSDRFIATEIIQLKSKSFRRRVADALIDSFKTINDPSKFYLLLEEPPGKNNKTPALLPKNAILRELLLNVSVEQMKGVDVIQITVESPSAKEAALIASCYSSIYLDVSQEVNRKELTMTKNFLIKQKDEKEELLNKAENDVKNYQEQKGFVSLDNQASTLISTLSQLESEINFAKIDLNSSNNALAQLKAELQKSDPMLAKFMENTVAEEYIRSAQLEIARLQLAKDMAKIDQTNYYDPRVERETDKKIADLQSKISERIGQIRNVVIEKGISEVKALSQRLLDEQIRNQSITSKINQLNQIYKVYDDKFNQLPKSSIEFADLRRKQEALVRLYTLIEQKYQEALVNEQSQPGYISVIDNPDVPTKPAKPNRLFIILIGISVGLILGVTYAFVRNYFDDTIKSPEDVEKKKINLISWIPPIPEADDSNRNNEFVVFYMPKAVSSEAFKVLRTRLQFSKLTDQRIQSFLVTSSVPGEGKTTISANLGASFALSGFKTIVIDCDFRKPRIHSFFGGTRTPGLVDYLFEKCNIDEIIYKSEQENLFYIPCGTIPPNPAEILQSLKIKDFFTEIHQRYEYVIVDSPPVLAVTDSELISQMTDVTILVALAGITQMSMVERVVSQFEKNYKGFAGVVLNNFNIESSYGSYYKYYYYYYGKTGKKKKSLKEKINKFPFFNE